MFPFLKVKEHTLFNYFQEWKRDREKENQRKRRAAEYQQRLERERKERERKEEEEHRHEILRRQEQIQLYSKQKKLVLELEAQMARASNKFDDDEVQRIGELYSKAYDEFRRLTRIVHPWQVDEDSISVALHKQN